MTPRLESAETTTDEITRFIARVVDESPASGVVVNLSGGIDSTVTATLAVHALDHDSVFGFVLPTSSNSDDTINDTCRIAEDLGIDYRVLNIQPLLDRFVRTLTGTTRTSKRHPLSPEWEARHTLISPRDNYLEAKGNAAARIRMLVAYFETNTTSRLVIGTGNRTERRLGYFTKYGDGGVDLLPIGHLFKSEVRDLARFLDIPEQVIDQSPSSGLWQGQTDETELGASYRVIDAILFALIEEEMTVPEVATALGVEDELVTRFAAMIESTAHKRNPPPIPSDHGQEEDRNG